MPDLPEARTFAPATQGDWLGAPDDRFDRISVLRGLRAARHDGAPLDEDFEPFVDDPDIFGKMVTSEAAGVYEVDGPDSHLLAKDALPSSDGRLALLQMLASDVAELRPSQSDRALQLQEFGERAAAAYEHGTAEAAVRLRRVYATLATLLPEYALVYHRGQEPE